MLCEPDPVFLPGRLWFSTCECSLVFDVGNVQGFFAWLTSVLSSYDVESSLGRTCKQNVGKRTDLSSVITCAHSHEHMFLQLHTRTFRTHTLSFSLLSLAIPLSRSLALVSCYPSRFLRNAKISHADSSLQRAHSPRRCVTEGQPAMRPTLYQSTPLPTAR